MISSNLRLNVTANTSRALRDFNKFSQTLDSKFLVSGLKLDVVRNALSQINREFQKSLGEQGLASASTLRAVQNQASLLTQTFKGFASESALAINRDIGTALNSLAVKAGGTMNDVRKTISATPFISTRVSADLKEQLTKGMLSFQRDARRAGLGDDFAGIARQFLSGKAMGRDLINSDNPLSQFLGSEILKRSGGQATIYDPKARSEILAQIVGDKDVQNQLKKMAKEAYGYRIILEDLNTSLFNTEKGVFGSLRKVIDRAGKSTTMFDEVYKLVDQVFGKNGLFKSLFSSISEVFKLGDPLRIFIDFTQFVTNRLKSLTDYFKSDDFIFFLEGFKPLFDRIKGIGTKIYKTFSGIVKEISTSSLDPSKIELGIKDIGKAVREYIQYVGRSIRNQNLERESEFGGGIIGTLVTEIGKTTIVLIKEIFSTFVNKAPEIAGAVLPALNKGINTLIGEVFGQFGGVAKMFMATMPGPVGAIARASLITDATGGQGGLGLLGAAAPFLLGGGGGVSGALRRAATGTGRGATAFRGLGLGLMGLDPLATLALSFAPNLLPGVWERANSLENPVTRARNLRDRAFNSRTGKFLFGIPGLLSSYGGSAANLLLSGADLSRAGISSAKMFINSQKSQFMAGYKPLFPNVAVGGPPTFSYGVGSFLRNFPKIARNNYLQITNPINKFIGQGVSGISNTMALTSNKVLLASKTLGSGLQSFGEIILNNSISTSNRVLSASKTLGSGLLSFGKIVLNSGISAALEIQRASRAFMMGASGQALFSRGRPLVEAGSFFRRRGAAGLLAGGLIVGGSQLVGNIMGGESGAQVGAVGSIVGGAMSGASLGATIGSVIPGLGTGLGAAIGGVIGGILPLLDKGVRTSTGKLVSGILEFMRSILTELGNTAKSAGRGIVNFGKMIMNFFALQANYLLSLATFLPNLAIKGLKSIPGIDKIPGAKQILGGAEWFTNLRVPYFYSGKNFAGPALSLEAKMSGKNPMVVNDGEFVIPSNGFSTLAGLVGQNLKNSSAPSQQVVKIDLVLNMQYSSLIADPDELAKSLKEPVIKIVNDAWEEANRAKIYRTRTA